MLGRMNEISCAPAFFYTALACSKHLRIVQVF